MANQEHLDILKQGIEAWNLWRQEHPDIEADLSGIDFDDLIDNNYLSGINFSNTYLSETDLSECNLSRAILINADLSRAVLMEVDFTKANLTGAHLFLAKLAGANLTGAKLVGANLLGADLLGAKLVGANFSDAELNEANLVKSELNGANLSRASIESTVFGDVDLRLVKGLGTIDHQGPSTIGIDTIIRSQGKIPEIFLRKAGVPDSIIEAIPSLVGSLKPIDYYSCFISYSSNDQDFAKRLHVDLQASGVRCWFAPEDMKIGDKIRPRIDESIRKYDKLLLVLSQHSVSSKWVEYEAEAALDKEQERKPTVLFPIRLDNTVMESTTAWAAHIKRTRHIGDFTHWKNHGA